MGFDDRLDNKGVERDSGLEAGWMVLPFTVIMNIEGCTDLVMNKMERRWRLFWIVLEAYLFEHLIFTLICHHILK